MQLVYVMKFVLTVLMDKRQTVVLQHVPSAQQVKCKPLQVLVFVKVVLLVVFNLQKLLLDWFVDGKTNLDVQYFR